MTVPRSSASKWSAPFVEGDRSGWSTISPSEIIGSIASLKCAPDGDPECDKTCDKNSQRHHDYCCERVSFTYLNASHAVCNHPQSIGPDGPIMPAGIPGHRMPNDFTFGHRRISEPDLVTVQHGQPYLARLLLGHYLGRCHWLDFPMSTRGQETHRHHRHKYTSGISGSEGFHSRLTLASRGKPIQEASKGRQQGSRTESTTPGAGPGGAESVTERGCLLHGVRGSGTCQHK